MISLPEIHHRALEVIDDPRYDIATLARIIESDSGLSVRLLKLVNRAGFGLSRRVDRVPYALALAGPQAVRDLILATPVARTFTGISPHLIDMATFWHHSLYCGLIARQLAKRCGVLHHERLAVAGLLHDIGQLALYQVQPVLAAEALLRAEAVDDGLYRAEREVFGYTHAEVGGTLLERWGLPDSLRAAARHHHDPLAAGEHVLDACIVHLANAIANRLEPGRNILDCRPRVEPRAWEITGIPEAAADVILGEANEQFLEILDLLLPVQPGP